jgi:hypothetical protein
MDTDREELVLAMPMMSRNMVLSQDNSWKMTSLSLKTPNCQEYLKHSVLESWLLAKKLRFW